ncbi:MAG: SDR family oxidoreductase [Gammaproteobacteria bacterium]|nr:SDR family oxidoreductase [Gammaproteobacteria bacterium]
MQHVLVTGANRGLGLAFCRHYLAQGYQVTAACRDPDAAKELQALTGALNIVQLDLADAESIQRLSSEFANSTLDILVNNAGVYGGSPQGLDDLESGPWLNTFLVNSVAPVLLTRALLPALQRSNSAKIAFLTSKMGSIGDNSSGRSYIYRSSKAALNAAIKSLAIDLAELNIPVIALHPGWVRTDMGGPNGLIDSKESIAGLSQVIDNLALEQSGCFVDYRGDSIPW